MQVKLIRKLARVIDGVDLTCHEVGEFFELPAADARLLIAEGWAEVHLPQPQNDDDVHPNPAFWYPETQRADAADEPTRAVRTLERILQVRRRLERRRSSYAQRRRFEDRIREELRDARARTVHRNG
jgi:hypothetical protein